MMIIPILLPMARDATSYYRGAGPLSRLSRNLPYLSFHQLASWDWSTLGVSKMIFMQRPFTGDHRTVFDMAKDNNKKVWLDYDDLLFDVPTDNPTYFKYMSVKCMNDVKHMISNADIVTVSTEALKEEYGKLNKDVRVIPNAFHPDLLIHRKAPPKREKIFLWRGSRTHHKDVFLHSPMILDVSRRDENQDWNWHFIGDSLWFLTDRMPHTRTFVMEPMDVIDYHKHIVRLAPTAMMVPLHNCQFNQCKSNIAWIEGSFAGAITLAPDWPEWRRPGMITYKSKEQFTEMLVAITKGEFNQEHLLKLSWDYIMSSLNLDETNKLRVKVICDLLECEPRNLGVI